MDAADIAQQVIDESLQAQIQNSCEKSHERLPYTGQCHACGVSVSKNKRFCDPECSAEWEWIKEREAANAKF